MNSITKAKVRMSEDEFKLLLSIVGAAAMAMYGIVAVICIMSGYNSLDIKVFLIVLISFTIKIDLIQILWPGQEKVRILWACLVFSILILISDLYLLHK